MRWLVRSATARAELDQDSRRGCQHRRVLLRLAAPATTYARRGISATQAVAFTSAMVLSIQRVSADSTRNRARVTSVNFDRTRATRMSLGVSGRLPSVRARRTRTGAWRTPRSRMADDDRQASTASVCDASSVSTSSARASPRCGINRATGLLRTTARLDLRRQRRNAPCARRASPIERLARHARPDTTHRIPATTSSWQSSTLEERRRRTSRAPARPRGLARSGSRRACRYRVAFARSPCRSRIVRAASSAFTGQIRSRETSAISASATTHLARATSSLGPKARAARRSSAFARTKSPSCAIAIPRSASAGASSRSATRFSAPRGSPAASA